MAKKILIYDDEKDILDICKFVLEAKGFEVETKTSCSDVVEELKASQPDVVIMDNWLPGTEGSEAIKLMKKDPNVRGIPVILFTANKDGESLASEIKADGFIAKPFELKVLEKTVKNVLERQ